MQTTLAFQKPPRRTQDMEMAKLDSPRRYRASSATPEPFIRIRKFNPTRLIPPDTWDLSVPFPQHLDQNEGVSTRPSDSEEILVTGLSAMLHTTKETFDLSIADLARLAGVSRPTVYSYLKGEDIVPQAETRARISALYHYAKKAGKTAEQCDRQMRHLMKRAVFEGNSLFDLMLQGKDIDGPLKTLLQIYRDEAQIGRELAERFKGRPVINPEDDISMPAVAES